MQTIDDRIRANSLGRFDAPPGAVGRARAAADARPGLRRRRTSRVVVAPVADLSPLARMLAHATRTGDHPSALAADAAAARDAASAPARRDEAALAIAFIRYLDLVLVVASTPFVLLAGLPGAGFAIGAASWILTRLGVGFLERRAWAARDNGVRTALHLGAILGRVWLVALAVLVARFAIGTPDGIAAAVVVLAAYTVELVTKLMLRGPITAALRRPS
jgi:hypothetical protein